MGWNAGYTIFEATVIGAYDLGKLDKELLSVLMEPYRGSDIDSGGSRDLVANDGLDVVDVVCKIWELPLPARPNLPADHRQWTKEQDAMNEAYWDERYEAFRKVTDTYGWR